MTWVKIDDGLPDHPKTAAVGPLGMALHVAGICYAGRHLTDGRIPRRAARRLLDFDDLADRYGLEVDPDDVIAELVAAELWLEHPDGFEVHGFLEWNRSKAQVDEIREAAKSRAALGRDKELRRAIRERDGDACRYCSRVVSWKDRRGPSGATYDHVIPGGGDTLENLVVACRSCNSAKGRRRPEDAGLTLHPPPGPSSYLDTNLGTEQESSRPETETEAETDLSLPRGERENLAGPHPEDEIVAIRASGLAARLAVLDLERAQTAGVKIIDPNAYRRACGDRRLADPAVLAAAAENPELELEQLVDVVLGRETPEQTAARWQAERDALAGPAEPPADPLTAAERLREARAALTAHPNPPEADTAAHGPESGPADRTEMTR